MADDAATGSTATAAAPRTDDPVAGRDGWRARPGGEPWRDGLRRRWWAPGLVSGGVAGAVAAVVAALWQAYEAGGCGDPRGGFACLGAALTGVVAAAVLGPLALWLLYRALGVARPVAAVAVAAAVALALLAVPEVVHQVRLGLGAAGPGLLPVPLLTGLDLGVAGAAGGLALQGPRRLLRGGVAAAALAVLLVVAFAQQPATDREKTRLDLAETSVPLLLPDGWAPASPFVDDAGGLSYTAFPARYDGSGVDGVRVDVAADLSRFGETCGSRACTDDGDVRIEVGQTGDGYGTRAWRVVDGALVTVTTGAYGPPVDLAAFLRGMRPVTVEEVLDRRWTEPR